MKTIPCFLLAPLLALFTLANTARATVLVFDQQRDAVSQTIVGPTSSGGRLPMDYGGNVTGAVVPVLGGVFTYGEAGEGFTPDVQLDIFAAGATPSDSHVRLWQNGYGDLVNVIFTEGPGIAGAPLLSVQFTAAPGYEVDLYGFDLAGFGTDYTIAGVSVFAEGTTLFSEADVLVEGDALGPGHTTIAFAGALSAPELLLEIDISNLPANIQDNIGLDNLRFGQTPIPEPTTLVLVAMVALMATYLRRFVTTSMRRRGRVASLAGDM
jgi:hypothetical protein